MQKSILNCKPFSHLQMDIFAISRFGTIEKKIPLEDVLQNGFLGIKAEEIELLKWNPTPLQIY